MAMSVLLRSFSLNYLVFGLLLILLQLGGCATLPPNTDSQSSFAPLDTGDTRLGRQINRLIAENAQGIDRSGVLLLGDGLDAFAARITLAQGAERTIDAQYYMIHADLTGALFAHQLIAAADRGVKVRLLIDDMDLENRDESLSALGQHPHIELRIFNPFSRDTLRLWQYLSRLGSVTRRMHNKSFTVDNQVTVVGGRNIGNEYFDADPDLAFGDLDMLAIGPVVQDISKSFDEYWNSSLAYSVDVLRPDLIGTKSIDLARKKLETYLSEDNVQKYLNQLEANKLVERVQNGTQKFEWGPAQVFADNPEKLVSYRTAEEYSMAPRLSPFFQNLHKELLIFSPYFVPGVEGTKNLSELSRSGVRVRILTNSLASTDVGIVHSGYSKYRHALLRAGVELYEVNKNFDNHTRNEKKGKTGGSKASLHAKSFVLDRKKVFVGSLNLDPRSIKENTEVGIMLTSEVLAEQMAENFDIIVEEVSFRLELKTDEQGLEYILWHGLENGEQRTWGHDPHTSFWRRFFIGTLRFVPFVESQL
ncbi:MAG: putative cardiolipin synthase [Desulforhopalus sp.]|jgi:putative cardiolipin synthase